LRTLRDLRHGIVPGITTAQKKKPQLNGLGVAWVLVARHALSG
jgi:hypothetical protein